MSQTMVVGLPKFLHTKLSIQFPKPYASIIRRKVNFQPILWGNCEQKRETRFTSMRRQAAMDSSAAVICWGQDFLSYTSQLTEITIQEKIQLEELKEKVKVMLVETPESSAQKLFLIDTIQRLGVAYHFHNEIDSSLQNISQKMIENSSGNLYVVALLFRLVRQQGHYMSPDVFKQFTNRDGKFMETLYNDVEGLLSLYEASHMRVHGEDILEEALTFTTTHLKSMVDSNLMSDSLKVQVIDALDQPIRKSVPRVGARNYICIYENIEAHNDLLLKFAKLDFNMLQKLHQEEIHDLTMWCKNLDFANKYPYVRDMIVDDYFWIIGVCFESQYSRARKLQAKVTILNTIIDDTFDYATFDELVLFTDAIERWDIGAMDSLPPYMRPVYQTLMDIYNEMEQLLSKDGKSDIIYYAIKEMKKVVRAYLKEAKWLNVGYIPKCEEFMKNGLVTSTIMLYVTLSIVMEDSITKETFEWLTYEPSIVQAASTICRLYDDIIDYEVDKQRGNITSYVECYMKEYGVSKEVAFLEMRKEITNAWKELNKEFLRPTKASILVIERALNFARLVDSFFKDGRGGYADRKSKFKDMLTLLFVEPV